MSTLYVDNLQPNLGSRVMAAGHVVQVVEDSISSLVTSSSTFSSLKSFSITPTSATSKIVIMYSNHLYVDSVASNAWRGALIRLKRGSTLIYGDTDASAMYGEGAWIDYDQDRYMTYSHHHYVDYPETTSQVTYNLELASKDSQSNIQCNTGYGAGGRIMLMEIAQ